MAQRMKKWRKLWRRLWRAPDGPKAVRELLWYAMLANDTITIQDLRDVMMKEIGPTAGEVVMTLEEQIIAKFEAKGRAEGEVKGETRGEAKGRAQSVLSILRARGIEIPDEVSEKVLICSDLSLLETWLARAITCKTAEELFD